MKTYYWLILSLFGCCTFLSAQTEGHLFNSGKAFLRRCSTVESKQTESGLECILYIAGFVQGVEFGSISTRVETKQATMPMPFCRPDNVDTAQLVKIVLKYIRKNPEDANQHTMYIALRAFQEAFPCAS
jgi:hypothetical protein